MCKADTEASHQLQHLRRRDRRLHGGGGSRTSEYDLINPRTGKEVAARSRPARSSTRSSSRPGRPASRASSSSTASTADNPTPHLGEIESTNPCGEQPLLPYESCNLGSINLAEMVKKTAAIDWTAAERTWSTPPSTSWTTSSTSTTIPLHQIQRTTRQTRKIGLGVMGLADMLIDARASPTTPPRPSSLAEKVMGFIQDEAHLASAGTGREPRRLPQPTRQSIYDGKGRAAMRNATVTTIAPTGTISHHRRLLRRHRAPLRRLLHPHRSWTGTRLVEVNPLLRSTSPRSAASTPQELMEKHRRARHRPGHPRDPRGRPQRVRHRPRHHPRRPHQDAGGLPEVHRQRRLQDGQLPQHRHHRRRRRRSTCWPTNRAARASPSTATAPATSRS